MNNDNNLEICIAGLNRRAGYATDCNYVKIKRAFVKMKIYPFTLRKMLRFFALVFTSKESFP